MRYLLSHHRPMWNSSKWKYAVTSIWIRFVHILQWPNSIEVQMPLHRSDPIWRQTNKQQFSLFFSFFFIFIFFLYLNQYFSKSFSVIIPILLHSICLMRVCHCFNVCVYIYFPLLLLFFSSTFFCHSSSSFSAKWQHKNYVLRIYYEYMHIKKKNQQQRS